MDGRYFACGEFDKELLKPGGLSRRLLAFGGELMLAEMEFEEGAESAPHAHAEEQLTHCLSGEFATSLDGIEGRIGPGDSFYAGSGILHGASCLVAGKLIHVFTPQRVDYK